MATQRDLVSWQKTSNGYRALDGAVKLVKRGKVWFLLAAGRELELGRRASFDTADRALRNLLGR